MATQKPVNKWSPVLPEASAVLGSATDWFCVLLSAVSHTVQGQLVTRGGMRLYLKEENSKKTIDAPNSAAIHVVLQLRAKITFPELGGIQVSRKKKTSGKKPPYDGSLSLSLRKFDQQLPSLCSLIAGILFRVCC